MIDTVEVLEKRLTLSFPYHVLKGAGGYYTKTHSAYLEVPPQFFFMAYLTCLGAVVSRRVRLESALKTQPRLYTVIVGESASDRKSTAIDFTIDHFRNVFGEKFSFCMGLGSAEGLQRVLNKEAKKDEQDCGLILAFDEFKAFVNKCKIKSSVLLECVNTLFEITRYENHTKKASIEIDNAQVSLLGASTMGTYERIYDSSFITIGFPNRIFLVTGTSNSLHSLPGVIPKKKMSVMELNTQTVYDFVGKGRKFAITQKAWNHYDRWYRDIDRDSVHSKRLDGYCLRLMMLLACNSLKHEITLEIVKDAISLCNWQFEIRKIYDPIDADNNIAKMEEKIRRKLLERGALRDYQLKQAVNANRAGLWIYEKAKTNLKDADEIEWDKKKQTYSLVEDE